MVSGGRARATTSTPGGEVLWFAPPGQERTNSPRLASATKKPTPAPAIRQSGFRSHRGRSTPWTDTNLVGLGFGRFPLGRVPSHAGPIAAQPFHVHHPLREGSRPMEHSPVAPRSPAGLAGAFPAAGWKLGGQPAAPATHHTTEPCGVRLARQTRAARRPPSLFRDRRSTEPAPRASESMSEHGKSLC